MFVGGARDGRGLSGVRPPSRRGALARRRSILLFALVTLLVAQPGPSSAQDDWVDQKLYEAYRLLDQGQVDAAIRSLEGAAAEARELFGEDHLSWAFVARELAGVRLTAGQAGEAKSADAQKWMACASRSRRWKPGARPWPHPARTAPTPPGGPSRTSGELEGVRRCDGSFTGRCYVQGDLGTVIVAVL